MSLTFETSLAGAIPSHSPRELCFNENKAVYTPDPPPVPSARGKPDTGENRLPMGQRRRTQIGFVFSNYCSEANPHRLKDLREIGFVLSNRPPAIGKLIASQPCSIRLWKKYGKSGKNTPRASTTTWNCRHIVNAEIMKRLIAVAASEGYALPVLCTPEQLMGE